MITGDHTAIAKETARRLGMGGGIYAAEAIKDHGAKDDFLGDVHISLADGFLEKWETAFRAFVDRARPAAPRVAAATAIVRPRA